MFFYKTSQAPELYTIMVSMDVKHELFRQYKNGIVIFDHNNYYKNNFTTTLCVVRYNYFQRRFTECSNYSRNTQKTLNSLIRCENTHKDFTMTPRSVTP